MTDSGRSRPRLTRSGQKSPSALELRAVLSSTRGLAAAMAVRLGVSRRQLYRYTEGYRPGPAVAAGLHLMTGGRVHRDGWLTPEEQQWVESLRNNGHTEAVQAIAEAEREAVC